MLDQSCKLLLCAGFSFASDWDETQPMEDATEMTFDMSMPLTEAEEKHVSALAADSPAEAWVLLFQICLWDFQCQRSWPSVGLHIVYL